MSMSHLQLRAAFGKFWEERGHKPVPPVSLVPDNDPTTLFTGSGMQPLVPYLLGEPHPLGKKLYNIQPCFRAQDIDEVGDNRHTTFFEMMGNWSLGTYFKEEQIPWMWEFYHKVLGLDKERLYVSVFEGNDEVPADEESYKIWKKLGIDESHLFKYGADKNWWSRSGEPQKMPAGEPGGPDTELFYEFTEIKHDPKFGKKCHPNCDCGRFLEIGNSVFMQYKKETDGTFFELPNKNVDFGGGLERILAAVNNTPDVFQTDLYADIISEIEQKTGKKHSDENNTPSIRVLADHLKATTFLLAQGIKPSNKEQGYVARRLIRRSVVKMQRFDTDPKQLASAIVLKVLDIYQGVYFPDAKSEELTEELGKEIHKFLQTLGRGVKLLQQEKKINGQLLFDLFQSYGFPLEVSEEILKEHGKPLTDTLRGEFEKAREAHRDASRTSAAGRFKGGLADSGEQTVKYHTATHLIHQALFDVLGTVRQDGSNITTERLRFDFYSEVKPTKEQIAEVEKIANAKVEEGLPVRFEMMPKEEAEKIGARSFFKEKYADTVKVYYIGGEKPADAYSSEFCGGPHVTNTKEVGKISIYKFEKIGANLYRVYAK